MNRRPSEVLFVKDEYWAYCLDEAVITFGSWLAAKLDAVEGKNAKAIEGKRKLILAKVLDGVETEGHEPGKAPAQFKDPADMFKKPAGGHSSTKEHPLA